MKEYIELGSTPYDEECAQIGSDDYYERSIKECYRYKGLLERKFPDMPDGCKFMVKSFRHDFGTYREVVICYNNDISEEIDFAFMVEGNLPARWDD